MKPFIEHLPVPLEASFRFKHTELDTIDFVWHCHQEYELTHILKGEGRRFVGDHIGDFHSGDLIFTGPGLPHTWYSEDKCEAVVIQFKESFLGEHFFELPEMQPIKNFFDKASRGIAFEGSAERIVRKKLQQLMKSYTARRIILLLDILDILASAEEYTILSSKQFSIPVEGEYKQRMDKVLRFINESYLEPISLQQISEIAAMSAPAFCRFFKNSTGKVFKNYLNELRIGHACMLLVESDKSISEICFESGFNNLSNFNRHFARYKKMSPGKYRKEFRKNKR